MESSINQRKQLYTYPSYTGGNKLSEFLFLSPQQLSNRHDQLYLKKIIFRLKVKEMVKRWKKASKKSKKRLLILREWSVTEQSYIKDLEIIVENIQKPLRQKLLISHEDEVKVLFPNLKEMIRLSQELLKEINIFISLWNPKQTMIGQKLAYFYRFFMIYRDYCKNFLKGQKIIKILRENNPEIISNIERNLKLDIESYLIKPIQRPPKYQLLLREYLKNIPQNHSDTKHIKNTLQKYHEINEANNESMEQQMRIDKMIELDVRYGGSIIKSKKGNRCLIEEFDGYTMKKVCKIYLFNDMLFVVEMEKQEYENEVLKKLSQAKHSGGNDPSELESAVNRSSRSSTVSFFSSSESINSKKGIRIELDGTASWVETSMNGKYFVNIVFVCGTRQNIHLFFHKQRQKREFYVAVKTVIRDLYQKESYRKSLMTEYSQKVKKYSETSNSNIVTKKIHQSSQLPSFLPSDSTQEIQSNSTVNKYFNRISLKARETILYSPSDRASSRFFGDDQKSELLHSPKQGSYPEVMDLPNFRIKVVGVQKRNLSTVNTDTLYIARITTPYPYKIFQYVYLRFEELSELQIHLKTALPEIKIPDLFEQPQNMGYYDISKNKTKIIEYKTFFIERFLNFIIRDPQIMLNKEQKIVRSLKILEELWKFSKSDIQKCECEKCLQMLEPEEMLKDENADYHCQNSSAVSLKYYKELLIKEYQRKMDFNRELQPEKFTYAENPKAQALRAEFCLFYSFNITKAISKLPLSEFKTLEDRLLFIDCKMGRINYKSLPRPISLKTIKIKIYFTSIQSLSSLSLSSSTNRNSTMIPNSETENEGDGEFIEIYINRETTTAQILDEIGQIYNLNTIRDFGLSIFYSGNASTQRFIDRDEKICDIIEQIDLEIEKEDHSQQENKNQGGFTGFFKKQFTDIRKWSTDFIVGKKSKIYLKKYLFVTKQLQIEAYLNNPYRRIFIVNEIFFNIKRETLVLSISDLETVCAIYYCLTQQDKLLYINSVHNFQKQKLKKILPHSKHNLIKSNKELFVEMVFFKVQKLVSDQEQQQTQSEDKSKSKPKIFSHVNLQGLTEKLHKDLINLVSSLELWNTLMFPIENYDPATLPGSEKSLLLGVNRTYLIIIRPKKLEPLLKIRLTELKFKVTAFSMFIETEQRNYRFDGQLVMYQIKKIIEIYQILGRHFDGQDKDGQAPFSRDSQSQSESNREFNSQNSQ